MFSTQLNKTGDFTNYLAGGVEAGRVVRLLQIVSDSLHGTKRGPIALCSHDVEGDLHRA